MLATHSLFPCTCNAAASVGIGTWDLGYELDQGRNNRGVARVGAFRRSRGQSLENAEALTEPDRFANGPGRGALEQRGLVGTADSTAAHFCKTSPRFSTLYVGVCRWPRTPA